MFGEETDTRTESSNEETEEGQGRDGFRLKTILDHVHDITKPRLVSYRKINRGTEGGHPSWSRGSIVVHPGPIKTRTPTGRSPDPRPRPWTTRDTLYDTPPSRPVSSFPTQRPGVKREVGDRGN